MTRPENTPTPNLATGVRRRRMPATDPAKAAANHAHPCSEPVEMPEKNAPTLHPKASREA